MKVSLLYIIALLYSTTIISQNKTSIELFNEYKEKCKVYAKKSQLDSLEIYLKKIDQLSIVKNDSSYYYQANLIKGTYLTVTSQYEIAMKKLLKATQFFKLQKDSANYYLGRYKIGVCNYYVNRREEARKIMNEMLTNSKHITEQMKTNALNNLGALSIELGILNKNDELIKESIPILKQAIALNLKNKKYGFVSSNYSLLAEAHNQLGRKDKALALLDSALYYARETDDATSEGFALIKKANILTTKKRFAEALKSINKSVEIHQKGKHIPTLIYAFVEKKKLLVAMQAYKDANNISDSIYSYTVENYDKRFADGISEMEVKYKTAEKERQILTQRADIAEKGLLIQKKNYQIYIAVGLAFLMALFGYFFYKQQQLKQKQLIKENQLKTALQKIETQNKLQEQRLRISRDLHDNIGAQLSFIISSVDNLQYATKNVSDDFKEKLVYISKFTSQTISQLRDTIWAMNKNEISLKDLHSRVLSFIEKAKVANNDIVFDFKNSITSEVVFTSIKGMNIFRVIQEAINNSLKYAKANKISIHFSENKDIAVLTIKDDGIGFDKKTIEFGNGLRNMQDRITEIDGEFEINSTSNGTKITVSCKINKTNKV